MREIDRVPIPDIMRITELESESGTYAIINRVKSELQASRTLRAFMNVSISTEADIAVALDMPEEVVKHHLREPVIPHEKLYHLIFPKDCEYDYNSIQSLWELEREIENKVIQPQTEPTEDGTPGEDPHIEDGNPPPHASKEVEEVLQGEYPLPLTTIAERIGVPAELDKVLEQIDENINTALKLEENLKQVASHLGVPDTVEHIKQRIDELENAPKVEFLKGLEFGINQEQLREATLTKKQEIDELQLKISHAKAVKAELLTQCENLDAKIDEHMKGLV